ncbi:MAG: exonuclease domain-containing protein [bacterium]
MNNAVFQLLYQFDGEITEKQIRQALNLKFHHEIEQLRSLLESDIRFIGGANSGWKCVPLEELVEDQPISEVEFVITDLETTGSIKGKDRIIEIAALRVRDGQVIDQFESLVDPQKKISWQITNLTKITNETVANAPTIEEVLPQFTQFADNGIFVAHNSLFDYSFIMSELGRLELAVFKPQIEICTFRLARRLLPNVKARGISGLSIYFDYQMENRHRAMSDVLATTFFLNRFLQQLETMGIKTLYQLIEFQRERLTKKKLIKRIKRLRKKHAGEVVAKVTLRN